MWRRKRNRAAAADLRRSRAEMHQRSRDFIDGLGLPPVSSVRELVPFVETYTGRPIVLMPVAGDEIPHLDASAPCGLWLATETTDYIFYDETTSRAHADGIIGHELGHRLRGHEGAGGLVGTLGGLVPDLNPEVIAMLLARTRYAEPEEREAETLGSLLLKHVNSRPGPSDGDDPIARTLLR
ncbi:hypothetical protein [Streptomyces sp. WAC05292]|uniref:hypothetical protein n=1 Tax=Streptomyces sp. WAC05292 TaxID=2487418 RepID=UPI00163B9E4D|nr:hypothetical protein [Streptomyces sp. WAC05292]